MGDKVVFPNAKAFSQSVGSYWSLKNTEIHPSCIVLPSSAQEVSEAVSTLSLGATVWKDRCQFAIRGGGHTPWAGAANIEQGIVIDTSNLPAAGLSKDKKTITVSPSWTWDQVYSTLDPHNVSTLGGRVGGVGVGGLVTGCGISYYSPRYGFTCDVVENFEVVLATGDIVNANATSHADLFKALRGGGNNFGVVTAITLQTFPQGKFWGGQTFHPFSTRKANFKALERLITTHPYDPYAHFINTLVINNMTFGNWIIGNSLQYTASDPPVPFPEVFKPMTDLPRFSPFGPLAPDNTLRIDNITDFTMEYASLFTYKKRWLFASIAFGPSAEMMETFFQLANRTVAPFTSLPGFQLSISYQPLPSVMSERRGSVDSLGPIQTGGDMWFVHWGMAVDGEYSSYDKVFQNAVRELFEEAGREAEKLGVKRSYVPMTYADGWQDPIGTRSEGTIREMWETSRKYDPLQVFQKQVPGGFKLPKVGGK
ncbi:FAD-linked oxidoreductase-like protein 1 [Elsinoe australis]|uniref:FAD-linked oxidoreductase-like protein 1 n=1 Tax=Elsinoe australis TaxID=40998 RepID=A0A4U7B7W2_9PEZI|nr:FAD-linked oxidoreductase-like protein 1 [Elsinoe australis]